MRTTGMRLAAAMVMLCGSAAAQDIGTVAFQNGMLLGRGFDSVSGLPRNDCVAYDTTPSPPTAIRAVDFDLLEVTSTSDILATTSVTAGAAVNAAVYSASAEMSFASSSRITSFEASLLARVNVERTWQLAVNPRLRPEFATLAQTDPLAFRTRCGDRFVAGVLYGGAMMGLIRAQTRSESDRQTISTAFRASYNSFSANGSFAGDTATTLSSASLEIEGFVRGGGPQALPIAFDALRARLQGFPQEVQTSGGAEISAMLLDYSVLVELPVPGFTATVLERMASLFWDFHGVRREIDFILANPAQFNMVASAWQGHLTGLRGQAQAAMDRISRGAESCRANPDACALPTGLPEPSDLRGRYPLRFAGACGRQAIAASRLPRLEVFPLGRRTRGDDEMDGHNPRISIVLNVVLGDSGRRLTANTTVRMSEDRADWTTFEDSRSSLLMDLRQEYPSCYVLEADVNPRSGTITGRGGDDNHNWTAYGNGSGILSSASCLSDTRGRETGRIGCRTIQLRPIELILRHEEARADDGSLRLAQVRQQQQRLDVSRAVASAATRIDARTVERLRAAAGTGAGTQYLRAALAEPRVQRLPPGGFTVAPRALITPRATAPAALAPAAPPAPR